MAAATKEVPIETIRRLSQELSHALVDLHREAGDIWGVHIYPAGSMSFPIQMEKMTAVAVIERETDHLDVRFPAGKAVPA